MEHFLKPLRPSIGAGSRAAATGIMRKSEYSLSVNFTKIFDEIFFQIKQCNMSWAHKLEWE